MAFSGLQSPENTGDALKESSVSAEDILPTSRPFDDVKQSEEELLRISALSAVLNTVTDAYNRAKDARSSQEKIWLDSYRSWRGEYSPEEKAAIAVAKARNMSSSEVFIKITKTKATAALGQIQEILFTSNKFPISIEATPEPKGIAKEAFIVPENTPIPDDVYGYKGDDKEITPGSTKNTLLGGLMDRYKALTQGKKIMEGPSPDPSQFPQINPADEAAENMERTILDQMEEGEIKREIRRMCWETVVLGTGCLKGPLTYTNTIHNWKKDGDQIKYAPEVEDIPRSFYVSIWNLYPDPDCTAIQEAGFVVEKHLLNRTQVAELKKFSGFDKDAIDRLLKFAPHREQEYWEQTIRDINGTFTDDRYEILEYWGYLEKEHIEQLKPKERDKLAALVDQAQVNVWICNGELLRLVVNPFVPARIPYYTVPFEEHEYQLWGISIPENMKDPQMLMNGHVRMWIDNLRFAGNVILEVNEAAMAPGQGNDIYPGKVFRKQTGNNQPSISAINIPNVAPAHIQAFDKARQLADEATGQPSYSYGQTGVTSTNRTAMGMSMLMSAAAGNIKQVVKNFDEFLLRPLGEAYFAWNMQFNEKADIRGDLKVVAKGTSALMQKEVQSQRLLQFLQIVSSNQLLTPFANMDYILREIAKALDLDPEKTVNDPQMARLVADIMGAMNNPQGQQQQVPSQEQGQPPAQGQGNINPNDMTGGGGSMAGVGGAPGPSNSQFSGNM